MVTYEESNWEFHYIIPGRRIDIKITPSHIITRTKELSKFEIYVMGVRV